MNTNVKQLIRIENENYIWVIYIFILIFNFISNKYEKDYIIYNNLKDQKIYLTINKIVVIVLFLVYLYFLGLSLDDIKSAQVNVSKKRLLNLNLQLIANVLFVIGGAIIIYISFNSENYLIE